MREHLFSHKWLVAFIPVTNSDWQIHKHSQTHNFPKLICWLICAYHQNACDSSRCSWESEYVMERNKGCRGLLGEHTANSYRRRDTDNDAWQWGSIKRKKNNYHARPDLQYAARIRCIRVRIEIVHKEDGKKHGEWQEKRKWEKVRESFHIYARTGLQYLYSSCQK